MSEIAYTIENTLEERKVDLIFRLYVDPADQDYLAARWAFNNGLFQSFHNSAGQAVEKYLKAALLLQDQPVIDYGHRIHRLYNEVSKRDPNGCLPASIDLPNTTSMGREAWQGKPTSLFANYLRVYGSPDNRFAFQGNFINGPVLHALDILCHALRRLMRHTNFIAGDIFDTRGYGHLHEPIAPPLDWMLRSDLLLECLFVGRYSVGQTRTLRETFLNLNMAFGTERHSGERSFGGQGFYASPPYNALVRIRKIDPSPENEAIVNELRQWASERIYMSKDVKKQLGYVSI